LLNEPDSKPSGIFSEESKKIGELQKLLKGFISKESNSEKRVALFLKNFSLFISKIPVKRFQEDLNTQFYIIFR